ncbi:MAG: hypothetical protein Q7S02_00840 [bacterium]|nr:hypothetical protein [bacterium]
MQVTGGNGVAPTGTALTASSKRRVQEEPPWEPEWRGRIFRLINMRYESHRDRVTRERKYSVDVVLDGPGGALYPGKATGSIGTITAFDVALRTALLRWVREFALPEMTLLSYRIALVKPERGMESPAYAKARVRFGGRVYKRKVVHADGETAMCLVLLGLYDEFCYERWKELLRPSGVTPEDALANVHG